MDYYILIKRYFLGLFLIIIFNTSANAGWGGMTYPKHVENLVDNVYKILIKNKICSERYRDCTDMLIMSNHHEIIHISVYSLKDIQVANKIVDACIDEYIAGHKLGHKKMGIHFTTINMSYKEIGEIGFFDGLFNDHYLLKLKLRGEEK